MENDIDDETTTKVLDHILIRDPQSGDVLVNKRGVLPPCLSRDNSEGNSHENYPEQDKD